jgi:hypothetical protein
MCCSDSNCLHVFYCCFYCLFVVLMHCHQIEWIGLFLFSYIYWGLLCALRYVQFCRRFNELLRRMYIMQKLGETFCRHQLGLFDRWCDLENFFIDFFCLHDLSIGDRAVFKSPTTTMLEIIYVFRSFKVCLMKLDTLTLGAYKLIIVISFLVYFPFY